MRSACVPDTSRLGLRFDRETSNERKREIPRARHPTRIERPLETETVERPCQCQSSLAARGELLTSSTAVRPSSSPTNQLGRATQRSHAPPTPGPSAKLTIPATPPTTTYLHSTCLVPYIVHRTRYILWYIHRSTYSPTPSVSPHPFKLLRVGPCPIHPLLSPLSSHPSPSPSYLSYLPTCPSSAPPLNKRTTTRFPLPCASHAPYGRFTSFSTLNRETR